MAPDGDAETPLQRLERIDTALTALRREVIELRRELLPRTAPAPSPVPTEPGPSSPRPTRPPEPGLDFEHLIGRYGTVAIATVAILLGVGAFLQWAIARGLLGPWFRVGLGALAALSVAALGIRLRRTGSLRFGNVLLAIALAIIHVDAWAAGPGLGLVPSAVALAVATLASIALAMLAISDGQQSLFALGVGGAMLAPFVTSTGSGTTAQLLAFGWLIATAAIVALRDPLWVIARTVVVSGVGVYVSAALLDTPSGATESVTRMPAFFVLAVAVSAIAVGDAKGRRHLATALLGLLVLTLLPVSDDTKEPVAAIALAFLGTIAVHALRRRSEGVAGDTDSLVHAMLLPLGFLVVARSAIDDPTPLQATLLTLPWAALSFFAARGAPPGQKSWHYSVALTAVTLGVGLALVDQPLLLSSVASLLSLGILLTVRAVPGVALLLPLLGALLMSTIHAFDQLLIRPRYGYLPFLTPESLAALASLVAWVSLSRTIPPLFSRSESRTIDWDEEPAIGVARVAALMMGLSWGHVEFARAFSADQATFLLITYYAVAGVVMIGIGRVRASAGLRRMGIALAILGAGKAVLQASDLDNVALRIAAYLLVGVFLLGVGYWYRGGASTADVR